MKDVFSWQAAAALLLVFTHGLAQEVEVTGERVNLRAAPDPKSEIVGQAAKGDRLVGGEESEPGWLRVAMPAALSAWVYEPLAKEGVVQVSKLQVRSGPGINYRILGVVEKDQRLEIRNRKLDWLEIAPPPQCHVWISSAYAQPVEVRPAETANAIAPEAKPTTEPAPPVAVAVPEPETRAGRDKPPVRRATDAAPVARPPSARKPPMPARDADRPRPAAAEKDADGSASIPGGLRPAPGMPQGKEAVYSGRLHKAGLLWTRPTRYRLVGQDDKGRAVTVCYILDAGANLDALLGRDIVATGVEYWVQGYRVSTLVASKIVLKEP